VLHGNAAIRREGEPHRGSTADRTAMLTRFAFSIGVRHNALGDPMATRPFRYGKKLVQLGARPRTSMSSASVTVVRGHGVTRFLREFQAEATAVWTSRFEHSGA
jgi:hypothetical protein